MYKTVCSCQTSFHLREEYIIVSQESSVSTAYQVSAKTLFDWMASAELWHKCLIKLPHHNTSRSHGAVIEYIIMNLFIVISARFADPFRDYLYLIRTCGGLVDDWTWTPSWDISNMCHQLFCQPIWLPIIYTCRYMKPDYMTTDSLEPITHGGCNLIVHTHTVLWARFIRCEISSHS